MDRNSPIDSVGLALHTDRGVAEARKGTNPCFAPAPCARRGSRRPSAALTTASTVTAHKNTRSASLFDAYFGGGGSGEDRLFPTSPAGTLKHKADLADRRDRKMDARRRNVTYCVSLSAVFQRKSRCESSNAPLVGLHSGPDHCVSPTDLPILQRPANP